MKIKQGLITIVETTPFRRKADKLLTDAERAALIDEVASSPGSHDVAIGGHVFKRRFGLSVRGRSGGVRVVYYYRTDDVPVFLLTMFAKNERDNLSKAETAAIIAACRKMEADYRRRR